jgi:hypothetical protein
MYLFTGSKSGNPGMPGPPGHPGPKGKEVYTFLI